MATRDDLDLLLEGTGGTSLDSVLSFRLADRFEDLLDAEEQHLRAPRPGLPSVGGLLDAALAPERLAAKVRGVHARDRARRPLAVDLAARLDPPAAPGAASAAHALAAAVLTFGRAIGAGWDEAVRLVGRAGGADLADLIDGRRVAPPRWGTMRRPGGGGAAVEAGAAADGREPPLTNGGIAAAVPGLGAIIGGAFDAYVRRSGAAASTGRRRTAYELLGEAIASVTGQLAMAEAVLEAAIGVLGRRAAMDWVVVTSPRAPALWTGTALHLLARATAADERAADERIADERAATEERGEAGRTRAPDGGARPDPFAALSDVMVASRASTASKDASTTAVERDAELDRLRGGGDLVGLAEALSVRSASALAGGEWRAAAADLDEAAALFEVMERRAHVALCAIGAATALRAAGRHAEAAARIRRAVTLAPGGPSRIAALTTLAEHLRGSGEHAAAVEQLAAALSVGRAAGLRPFHRAALLRRGAQAFVALGRVDEARSALSAAIDAYRAASGDAPRDSNTEAFALVDTLIERAAVQLAARDRRAADAIADARATAAVDGDDAHLAELALLDARRTTVQHRGEIIAGRAGARDGAGDPHDRDVDARRAGAREEAIDERDDEREPHPFGRDEMEAIRDAERARLHALDGDAPLTYAAASLLLADLHERRGDRAAAYAILEDGWVGVAARLGEETAAAWFRPALEAASTRWGADLFDELRSAIRPGR